MVDFFDVALHFLGKNKPNVFTVSVGAMDGVMFDEMIGYTNMYNFKGLYVEPIPYLFDKLKTNLGSNHIFENSAISDYDGSIDMITIKSDVIDNKLVHDCFYGMSAVYPPKNGLGSEFDRPTVEKYGQMVKVPCITLDNLFKKHNISSFDVFKIDAEGHDYVVMKQLDLKKYRPSVIRCEWINLSENEQNNILNMFNSNNYKYQVNGQDITAITDELYETVVDKKTLTEVYEPKTQNINSSVTIVTGLWDIGRDSLSNDWSRSYDEYLKRLELLLSIDNNMIIFGDKSLQTFVLSKRKSDNTQFILRDKDWFNDNDYFKLIQKIRTDEKWLSQVGWLRESTQAKLEYYNPLVMSKMFLLHDAKLMDRFNSDYLFWLDAGISSTVHPGYFTHDKVLDKLPSLVDDFLFIAFPYETTTEIHGFDIKKLNEITSTQVNLVCRGGFFGGKKESIGNINTIYYSLLNNTLSEGYMGTEESLFSIILYNYSDKCSYVEIENNGLLSNFFENLKNNTVIVRKHSKPSIDFSNVVNGNIQNNVIQSSNVGLYVIGFNSPDQFNTLITSMLEYDKDFIEKPRKILLDNSTDLTTTPTYSKLCEKYGFEHIKKDNLGICGGRQWIAEHFEKSTLDYMYFFEDDMFFHPQPGVCRNGFNRFIPNLYNKSLSIIKKENFDFLKLNFTEFFGDNSTQWSWYNVPQTVREQYWPTYNKLPEHGIDENSPRVNYNNIKSYEGVPYADGDVYYCNWPQVISKKGNYRMFLETTWGHPYEQTWMSHMFQETKKGNLRGGILLMTPTEHNRFDHYSKELRKES